MFWRIWRILMALWGLFLLGYAGFLLWTQPPISNARLLAWILVIYVMLLFRDREA